MCVCVCVCVCVYMYIHIYIYIYIYIYLYIYFLCFISVSTFYLKHRYITIFTSLLWTDNELESVKAIYSQINKKELKDKDEIQKKYKNAINSSKKLP